MNDLLTQGLANGSPIALLTQGLIIEAGLFAVECLSIVLRFQVAALSIAIAAPSLEMSAMVGSLTLSAMVNEITIGAMIQAIALVINSPEMTINAADRCNAAT